MTFASLINFVSVARAWKTKHSVGGPLQYIYTKLVTVCQLEIQSLFTFFLFELL